MLTSVISQLWLYGELTSNGSQHANEVYEITGQEALSFSQAAEIISREVGRKISYVDITEEDSRGSRNDRDGNGGLAY